MKKRMIMLLTTVVLAVSFTACGDDKEGDKTAETKTDQEDGDTAADVQGGNAAADKVSYNLEECVTLGDYSALQISLPNTYEVTKKQVDEYAQNVAEYSAQPVYKDTDKTTVEEGDTVNIDYEGKKDGEAFEGGTAAGYNLTIGSHSFIDGFEEGLIGKNVGETVDLNLTFPENYGGDLSGAAVVFTVKINKIVEADTSAKVELTDEYVKQNLNYDTVKEYKASVKEYLEKQNESNQEIDTRQAVIQKLQDVCKVTVPEELLEARVADYVVQFTNQYCSDGTSLADYLSSTYNGMTEETFRSQIKTEMETNLNTELILEAIANKEGITLEEEAFQDYVKQQMEAYNYDTEEDFYKANGVDAASGEKYERKVYVCNEALDMVIDKASIEYGVTQEDENSEETNSIGTIDVQTTTE